MRGAMPEPQKNILGLPIVPCSLQPRTGFFRTGCCETGPEDVGAHVVCVVLTESFLAFSKDRGNDLSTPRPELGFPGLRPGDRWCLCASRWKEALDAGVAPRVVLASTHESALRHVSRADLLAHGIDGGSLN
jgi:uncharacterized protein (DUF2237 family)